MIFFSFYYISFLKFHYSFFFLQSLKSQTDRRLMGNLRDKPDMKKKTKVFRYKNLTCVTSQMCGWRTFMEDAILAIYPFCQNQDLGLFAIFDGHGGPQCSQYAFRHYARTLSGNKKFIDKNYEQALTESFIQIDDLMKSKAGMKQLEQIRNSHVQKENAHGYQGETVSGTTANVCLITKQYVYVANAGDSRCIAILKGDKTNKPSKIRRMSRDHKPVLETEKQRILKAGGNINEQGRINNNLNLSRALGDFNYKNNPKLRVHDQMITPVPQIMKTRRTEVSFILMGCDGIWESKTNQQMGKWFLKTLGEKKSLKGTIQCLLDQQVATHPDEQSGLDNMSAIIIQL